MNVEIEVDVSVVVLKLVIAGDAGRVRVEVLMDVEGGRASVEMNVEGGRVRVKVDVEGGTRVGPIAVSTGSVKIKVSEPMI